MTPGGAADRRDLAERLRRRAARAGLAPSGPLIERLAAYVALLGRWNARMNLTALDDSDRGLDRLIVEPLAAARHLARPAARVIDIGSGGGSPAVPLRLATAGGSLLMVEAKARKAAFLREAVRRLGLADTAVAAERFEQLGARAALRGAFDVLTVRAVRVDARALHGLQGFLRDGGELFLFQGPGAPDEPPGLEPPLAWRATHPLVASLQSRLVVLRKAPAAAQGK